MYIIYETDKDTLSLLQSKYLLLEVDTIEFSNGKTIRAFAVIDREHISFEEIPILESLADLHQNLIKNYRKKNWNYCKQAIDHLKGKFRGEMDSFYDELEMRISTLENISLAEDWTGNILSKSE